MQNNNDEINLASRGALLNQHSKHSKFAHFIAMAHDFSNAAFESLAQYVPNDFPRQRAMYSGVILMAESVIAKCNNVSAEPEIANMLDNDLLKRLSLIPQYLGITINSEDDNLPASKFIECVKTVALGARQLLDEFLGKSTDFAYSSGSDTQVLDHCAQYRFALRALRIMFESLYEATLEAIDLINIGTHGAAKNVEVAA